MKREIPGEGFLILSTTTFLKLITNSLIIFSYYSNNQP